MCIAGLRVTTIWRLIPHSVVGQVTGRLPAPAQTRKGDRPRRSCPQVVEVATDRTGSMSGGGPPPRPRPAPLLPPHRPSPRRRTVSCDVDDAPGSTDGAPRPLAVPSRALRTRRCFLSRLGSHDREELRQLVLPSTRHPSCTRPALPAAPDALRASIAVSVWLLRGNRVSRDAKSHTPLPSPTRTPHGRTGIINLTGLPPAGTASVAIGNTSHLGLLTLACNEGSE